MVGGLPTLQSQAAGPLKSRQGHARYARAPPRHGPAVGRAAADRRCWSAVRASSIADYRRRQLTPEAADRRSRSGATEALPVSRRTASPATTARMPERRRSSIGDRRPRHPRPRCSASIRQVVNLDAPQSSRVLTKGLHDGPALTADQASRLLEWIQAEKAADVQTGTIRLHPGPFTPLTCTGGNASDTAGCSSSPADPTHCCPLNQRRPRRRSGCAGATTRLRRAAARSGDAYVNEPLAARGAAAPTAPTSSTRCSCRGRRRAIRSPIGSIASSTSS